MKKNRPGSSLDDGVHVAQSSAVEQAHPETAQAALEQTGLVACSTCRARFCKRLRRPGIDSEDSIPPAYVAWRAGMTNWVVVPARPWKSIPGYAVLVEKVGLFLEKVGLFWKKPYFFSDCQVLVI